MRLDENDALARLSAHDHGILGTVHPERGTDLVPVVFAVDDDGFAGIPIDRIKSKTSGRLQRERNLEADPRATLLVERWDAVDWSQLWWVRAELRWQPTPTTQRTQNLADLLVLRYTQYRDRPFNRILVFRIVEVTGWSADSA
ncbi:MAG: pyridoxamine 5'-phosphate oxidase family protein [Acidimicrobiia bacterium]|nr:pyridoxamine 5'-phosphate oxidase family protein [Acidimicrobiia bacterium]